MNSKLFFENMRPVYLVCVNATANNNKYYRMIPDASGTGFGVEYGRVGAPKVNTAHYDASDFDRIYLSKLKKGYKDQTELAKTALSQTTGEDGFKAIQDADVATLINALRKYANEVVKANYSISQGAVTQKMIDAAKAKLDELTYIAANKWSVSTFNNTLNQLFSAIPRKMTKVQNYIASSSADFDKIIDREEKLLDVISTNFATAQAAAQAAAKTASDSNDQSKDILESLGLECKLVTDQTKIDEIKNHLGQVAPKFKRAYEVHNKTTEDRFLAWRNANGITKNQLLYHGSRNENFWSILKNGLSLNPNAKVTGKMLGNGIYFATKAIKSVNYTSLRGSYWSGGNSSVGYLAVFAVAIDKNKAYNVTTGSEISTCHGMTYKKLQQISPGSTHVYAHKGSYLREDELCVYLEDQVTIRYIIELKN